MQDLGGLQDDHVEEDFQEGPRASGQDAPACRCPPVRVVEGQDLDESESLQIIKTKDCDERAPFDDSQVSHDDTEAASPV